MIEKQVDLSNPIVVDLDGTLIKTDLLHEGILNLIRKNFIFIFLIPVWILKGRFYLKSEIFKRVKIKFDSLPYHEDLIEYLKEQKLNGRKIVLATASLKEQALDINTYLNNLFSDVYGSDNGVNLKSKKKRDFLVDLYGEKQFDYIGNSKSDIPIFDKCDRAIAVNASKSVISKVKKTHSDIKIFKSANKLKQFIKAIRVYQWVKNSLVMVPVITSQNWGNFERVEISIITIICFSLIASGGYLLNDLMDVESDRRHHRKKNRPIASGNISVITALIAMFFMIATGFSVSLLYDISTFLTLLLYFVLSTAYSFALKRIVLIDLFILAMLYTLRIIAGGIATHISLSFWLLGFSVFVFFSLAVMKRSAEIIAKGENSTANKIAGRGYFTEDLNFLNQIGIASGYMGIVVFALYINSEDVTLLYHSPQFLWLGCLLLMFWVNYLWYSTHKKRMTDDPIIFSLKNKVSIATLILIAISILISI